MNKKYQLLENDTIQINGQILYRIQALQDIPGVVKKGEFGGYIASEENLSHEGECWVGNEALVFGDAQVYGNAQIRDNAWIFGDAKVYDNARVYGYARVYDNVWVGGDMKVGGKIELGGDIILMGQFKLHSKEIQEIKTKGPVYVGGIEL